MTRAPRGPRSRSRLRSWILAACVLALVGIALSMRDPEGLGKWGVLSGLLLLVLALHRLGRSGPDPALEFEAPERPRKRKRKQRQQA